MPMRKNSTLIYFINSFNSKSKPEESDLIEKSINEFLASEASGNNRPSDQSVENILNFARSFDVCKTKSAGYVEMNLN